MASMSLVYVFFLCWNSHWVQLFILEVHWASLWPLFWTVYLIDCFPLFHLVLFVEISSVLLLGTCLLISPFWLPLHVCIFVLGSSALSSSLGRVVLYSSFPVGPIIPDHLSWMLHDCPLCGLSRPSIVVEPWLLLAYPWVVLTLRQDGYENLPYTV